MTSDEIFGPAGQILLTSGLYSHRVGYWNKHGKEFVSRLGSFRITDVDLDQEPAVVMVSGSLWVDDQDHTLHASFTPVAGTQNEWKVETHAYLSTNGDPEGEEFVQTMQLDSIRPAYDAVVEQWRNLPDHVASIRYDVFASLAVQAAQQAVQELMGSEFTPEPDVAVRHAESKDDQLFTIVQGTAGNEAVLIEVYLTDAPSMWEKPYVVCLLHNAARPAANRVWGIPANRFEQLAKIVSRHSAPKEAAT